MPAPQVPPEVRPFPGHAVFRVDGFLHRFFSMKRFLNPSLFRAFVFCLVGLGASSFVARANDEIFPPAPAAAPTISFDGKGFIIRGKREFIASGSIHYARVPRELWKDRLLKLKRAGFNTVQTYVFWNYHETEKGKFDFTTGSHDLGAFLQTAQDVGLYATVRVGPYDCAEWDSGGYPIWLRSEPNLKVRADNPAFLNGVDKFWEQLFPIVIAHQIHRGGNVILVQLENEDPQGWGTDLPNSYFVHLQKKALELGIEIPYFFSGLHHGTDPANDTPWDLGNRKSPWISTETWIRWFDKYGNSDPNDLAVYQRHIWNLVADCANGFNLYMFHGGTNFDYWNSVDASASYDYGAMLGQAGDLRNLYYGVKRASTFATSFPDILANCTNSEDASFATGPKVTIGQPPKTVSSVIPFVRRSPDGSVVFVRNSQNVPEVATLQSQQTLNLDPLEVAPLLVDTPLAPGIRVKLAMARTLGLATHGATTTWIVYGKPSEKGHLDLELDQDGPITPQPSSSPFQVQGDARHPSIDITFSENGPSELLFTTGSQTLRILAETATWTNRTWIIGERGAQTVVIGPDYVGDFAEVNGKAQFIVERPFGNAPLQDVVLYGEGAEDRHITVSDPVTADVVTAPTLGSWTAAKLDLPAAPDFPDAGWMSSDQPLQLGADGDPTAYGWYRSSFEAPTSGQGKLNGTFLNDTIVFLNGKLVGPTSDKGGISLDVQSGRNTLAIFSAFKGRQDYYAYVDKPIDTYDMKGLSGPVTVTLAGQSIPVTGWKLRGGFGTPAASDLTWEPAPTTDLSLPAFFRTEFNAKAATAIGPCPIYRLSTQGLTRGSVWLNDHNLGRYPEGLKVDGLYLPECWLKDGANSLVIFDEEGHVPTASVHLWCERAASREVFQVRE
jgi:beta-galactosidase